MFDLTDGLLGQGVRCALLVTMNEPLGRLHPAAWLAHHGCEETVHAPATLAELYARLEGPHRRARSSRARASGFAAGRLAPNETHSRRRCTPEQVIGELRREGCANPVPR
jgi:hypothetical protein